MKRYFLSSSIKAIKGDKVSKRVRKQIDEKSTWSKKHVFVSSVDDYFKLPKNQRELYGFWYKKPASLPSEFFGDVGGWETWTKRIQVEYPIQGWLREWCFSWDCPVYGFFRGKYLKFKDGWYKFKCHFNPYHDMVRDSIPETWTDISYLIEAVNFAMIRDFYYNEVIRGHVDWNSGPQVSKFYRWLKRAIKYIEVERPALEKQIEDAYPDRKIALRNDKNYKELYGEVDRLSEILRRKDTSFIKQMVEYREYFWT